MTDKKEDPKGKTLARQMAEEFAATINKRVMEKEQKVTEKPPQEAAETSANERPNFPSADELGKAFAAAINQAVTKEVSAGGEGTKPPPSVLAPSNRKSAD